MTDVVHMARPTDDDEYHCADCHASIKRFPGGSGSTYVHADSGEIAAPVVPPTFAQASAAYRKATEAFDPILQREALDVVKRVITEATVVRVLGEYNDEGLLTMRVQAIFNDAGPIATLEHPTDEFDAMCDEADPLFDWLITFNEEWWMGLHDIDIATGDAIQVS